MLLRREEPENRVGNWSLERTRTFLLTWKRKGRLIQIDLEENVFGRMFRAV